MVRETPWQTAEISRPTAVGTVIGALGELIVTKTGPRPLFFTGHRIDGVARGHGVHQGRCDVGPDGGEFSQLADAQGVGEVIVQQASGPAPHPGFHPRPPRRGHHRADHLDNS